MNKKILQLDDDIDLWLTYSWSSNNHGICGHTFEVIEYYYILMDIFKVGILLAEDITKSDFRKSIESKYDFSKDEVDKIIKNTILSKRPRLVKGRNILFTDGGIRSTKDVILLFDNIIHFSCGDLEIKNNTEDNVWILEDHRVYEKAKVNSINYVKKILFDHFTIPDTHADKTLVYATKNCRDLSSNDYMELNSLYDNLIDLTNQENRPTQEYENIEFLIPPISDIFSKFNKYVYTPISRKWDCSPRFIAECKYFNIKVEYYNIDYLDVDLGLRVRKADIGSDFNSLYLRANDNIIPILKEIIQ